MEIFRSSLRGMFLEEPATVFYEEHVARLKKHGKGEKCDGDLNASVKAKKLAEEQKMKTYREKHIDAMAPVQEAVVNAVTKTDEKVENAICDILTLEDKIYGLRRRVDEQNREIGELKRNLAERGRMLEEQGRKLADVEEKRLNIMNAVLVHQGATLQGLKRWQENWTTNLDHFMRKTQPDKDTYAADVASNLTALAGTVRENFLFLHACVIRFFLVLIRLLNGAWPRDLLSRLP